MYSLDICRVVYIFIGTASEYCVNDIQPTTTDGGIYVPNPKLVSGGGGFWSHLWGHLGNTFGGSGTGLVNKTISTYYEQPDALSHGMVTSHGAKIAGENNGIPISPSTAADRIVRFYYGFSNYLTTCEPAGLPLRTIAAFTAKMFYFLDIALEAFYVRMFKILNLSSYQPSSGDAGGISLAQWFHYGQQFGVVICVICLLMALIGSIFEPSSMAFKKMKVTFYDLAIGTFFIFALPQMTNWAADGAQSIAGGALGSGYGASNTMGDLTNQYFYDNVYDVPLKILSMKPGQLIPVPYKNETQWEPHSDLYDPNHSDSNVAHSTMNFIGHPISSAHYGMSGNTDHVDGGHPVPAKKMIVNLAAMSPQEQNTWNGLRDTSIPQWLDQYGTDTDVLDKEELKQLYSDKKGEVNRKIINKSFEKYKKYANSNSHDRYKYLEGLDHARGEEEHAYDESHHTAVVAKGAELGHGIKNKTAEFGHWIKYDGNQSQVASNTINSQAILPHKFFTGAPILATNASKATTRVPWKNSKKTSNQVAKNAKKGNIVSSGPSKKIVKGDESSDGADTKVKSMTKLFKYYIAGTGATASIQRLGAFHVFGIKYLADSYAQYKVNWADIYLGLILLAVVFISFISKLIHAFYKAMVMYAVAGILIARDVNRPDKLKQYIRNYFSLYEMIIMDVVDIRLFFVGYQVINNATQSIMFNDFPVAANTTVLGLVQAICDFLLLDACLKGVDAIDSQLGQPTGAKGSWSSALLGLNLGLNAARTGGRVAMGAGRGVVHAGADLFGKRGAMRNWGQRHVRNGAKGASKLGKNSKNHVQSPLANATHAGNGFGGSIEPSSTGNKGLLGHDAHPRPNKPSKINSTAGKPNGKNNTNKKGASQNKANAKGASHNKGSHSTLGRGAKNLANDAATLATLGGLAGAKAGQALSSLGGNSDSDTNGSDNNDNDSGDTGSDNNDDNSDDQTTGNNSEPNGDNNINNSGTTNPSTTAQTPNNKSNNQQGQHKQNSSNGAKPKKPNNSKNGQGVNLGNGADEAQALNGSHLNKNNSNNKGVNNGNKKKASNAKLAKQAAKKAKKNKPNNKFGKNKGTNLGNGANNQSSSIKPKSRFSKLNSNGTTGKGSGSGNGNSNSPTPSNDNDSGNDGENVPTITNGATDDNSGGAPSDEPEQDDGGDNPSDDDSGSQDTDDASGDEDNDNPVANDAPVDIPSINQADNGSDNTGNTGDNGEITDGRQNDVPDNNPSIRPSNFVPTGNNDIDEPTDDPERFSGRNKAREEAEDEQSREADSNNENPNRSGYNGVQHINHPDFRKFLNGGNHHHNNNHHNGTHFLGNDASSDNYRK